MNKIINSIFNTKINKNNKTNIYPSVFSIKT